MSKAALRREIAERLRNLPHDQIVAQSCRISEVVRELPEYKHATKVGIYMHMNIEPAVPRRTGRNVEVRTDVMLEKALADGKEVFLPRIIPFADLANATRDLFEDYVPASAIKMIKVHDVQTLAADNDAHPFNISEPADGDDALESGLDLIIVPGLVFNSAGHRIGRGKGFYDTFIATHNVRSRLLGILRPCLVGVGLVEQLVDHIPREEHDQVLDIVVTADNVFRSLS